jgi:hypothetical protein
LSFLDNKAYIHNKNFKISGEFLQLSQTMFKLRFEKEGLFLEFTGLKSTSEFFQTVGMNSVFDDRVSTGIGFISADYLHPNDLYDLKRIILENTGISEFNTLPSEKANVTKEKPFRHMLSVWKKHHYKNVSSQEIDGKYSSLYLKLMGESVPDNDNIISKIFGEGPNFYSNSMNRTLVDEVIRDNSEDKSIP